MADPKATKYLADTLMGLQKLTGRLIDTDTVDREHLHFIVAKQDRKNLVPALKAQGLSNRKIAKQLGVNPSTIDSDVKEVTAGNPATNAGNPAVNGGTPVSKSDPVSEAQRAAEAEKREAADVERAKRETLLRLAEGAYLSAGAFAVSQVRTELIDRLGDRKFTDMLAERLRFGVEGAPTIEEMLTGARELAKILKGVQG